MNDYQPATTSRDIRENCNPRPLIKAQLDAFYVETEAVRDPFSGFREAICSRLNAAQSPQRLLVYGHMGCGKSTELVRLAEKMGNGWLCVSINAREDLPSSGILPEDILLVIAQHLVAVAKKSNLPELDQDERLEKVLNWFKAETKSEQSESEARVGVSAGAKVNSGGWLLGLADLFAGFSSEIKYRTSSQVSTLEKVRRRPGDLIAQINRVIESVQEALQATGRKLLVIVENLDKMSLADARRVFLENATLLAGLRANLIYTIPIFTFYSPDAEAMKAEFDQEFSLPMIKVQHQDYSPADGFDTIKEIVHKRVAEWAIEAAALDLLVEKTGGVLRHVFEALQIAASMTNFREPPITKKQIEYALGRLKNELGLRMALPQPRPPGLDKLEDLYQKLVEFETHRRAGKQCSPSPDPVVQVLLQCNALLEYNGARWLGVHPLVLDYLRGLDYPV